MSYEKKAIEDFWNFNSLSYAPHFCVQYGHRIFSKA